MVEENLREGILGGTTRRGGQGRDGRRENYPFVDVFCPDGPGKPFRTQVRLKGNNMCVSVWKGTVSGLGSYQKLRSCFRDPSVCDSSISLCLTKRPRLILLPVTIPDYEHREGLRRNLRD